MMHKFWVVAVGCALSVGMGVAQENFRKIVPQGRMVQKYQDSEDGPVRVSAGGTRFKEISAERVGDTVQPDAEMFQYDFVYTGILESADPEDKTSLLGLESQAGGHALVGVGGMGATIPKIDVIDWDLTSAMSAQRVLHEHD